mgnify:CR=1 FL=1
MKEPNATPSQPRFRCAVTRPYLQPAAVAAQWQKQQNTLVKQLRWKNQDHRMHLIGPTHLVAPMVFTNILIRD